MFSHPFADPDDVRGSFWHEDPNPHDHMVYWRTRPAGGDWGDPSPEMTPSSFTSEPVQTYAPTDIYALNIGREVRESDGVQWVEWHGYTFYCEGHYSGWAHMDKPSEAILAREGVKRFHTLSMGVMVVVTGGILIWVSTV